MSGQIIEGMPFDVQFRFTDVDDDTRLVAIQPIPYNLAIYALTMTVSSGPQAAFYHAAFQFQDYQTGATLFDEPLFNGCFQADARTPWYLPSKWWIKKNSRIFCSIDSFDSVATRTYYVTMLGYVTDIDPNPGIQPFVYSFPISVGFQDNSGGATSVPFGQNLTGTKAKHMLRDFDMHAVTFDAWGTMEPQAVTQMSFQLSTEKRKLFDRMIINGVAGGSTTHQQGDTIPLLPAAGQNVHGWPEDNSLQYPLPKIERVPRRQLVRVDVAPAPTYVSTDDIHAQLNQQTCMAVIGNHIL